MDQATRPAPVVLDGWTVWDHEALASTNDVAADLPPWSAVVAGRQTAGRGRYRRVWVSDLGGLWMSAVVPQGRPERGWGALPLAAGVAVCEALREVGAGSLRLRWPNDVMVGRQKLAGILVDQFRPETAVIGIGINVSNQPEAADPALAGDVTRLAALLPAIPERRVLIGAVLARVRGVVGVLLKDGFGALVDRVNPWWQVGVPMDIETADGQAGGTFLGVDQDGRLRIGDADGGTRSLAAHQVVRVREKTEERWL